MCVCRNMTQCVARCRRTYPALETLTEPHRLIACLHCLAAVARPMLSNHRWFPEGRSHLLPILNLCLPGIDSNDMKKTMATFQIMSCLVNLVPLVDCSRAVHIRSDLSNVRMRQPAHRQLTHAFLNSLCLSSQSTTQFARLFGIGCTIM